MSDVLKALCELVAAAGKTGPELTVKHKVMENGEERCSFALRDGGECIITIAAKTGGWQNAHYHGGPNALIGLSDEGLHEHYVVYSGWMAVAMWGDKAGGQLLEIYTVKANDSLMFQPGVEHNIYLPAGAVIFTIKTGTPVGNPEKKGNDWWSDDKLDTVSKALSTEAEIQEASFGHPREYL